MKKLLTIISVLLVIGCNKKTDSGLDIPEPVASFQNTDPGFAPTTISFSNYSQNADSFKWDFGDTKTSKEMNPDHTYNLKGTYTVKLTAYGHGKSNTMAKQIVVPEKPPVIEHCKINKITILSAEPKDGSGKPWDVSDAPDIYVVVYVKGAIVYNSVANRFNNNTTYPISWTLTTPVVVSGNDFYQAFFVYVKDYDTSPDLDDDMDSHAFQPNSEGPPFPSTITADGNNAKVRLDVEWY